MKNLYYFRQIAERIDVNKDGKITTHEMENWIESNMKRYSLKNTNDRLKEWDMNKDDHISWNEYVARFSVANSPKKKNILDSEKRRFDVSIYKRRVGNRENFVVSNLKHLEEFS